MAGKQDKPDWEQSYRNMEERRQEIERKEQNRAQRGNILMLLFVMFLVLVAAFVALH